MGVGVRFTLSRFGRAPRISAIALRGLLVLKGAITVGTLVAFLGYIGGLFYYSTGLRPVRT